MKHYIKEKKIKNTKNTPLPKKMYNMNRIPRDLTWTTASAKQPYPEKKTFDPPKEYKYFQIHSTAKLPLETNTNSTESHFGNNLYIKITFLNCSPIERIQIESAGEIEYESYLVVSVAYKWNCISTNHGVGYGQIYEDRTTTRYFFLNRPLWIRSNRT